MFSQLGPLFKTVFRKAEQSDARFEIRREEKDTQKKEDEEREESPDDVDLWADSTNVSIQALRNFLIDFLKSKGDAVPEEGDNIAFNTNSVINNTEESKNSHTQRALKAYKTMSSYAQTQDMAQKTQSQQSTNGQTLSDLLAVDELRTMHVLISELDILFKAGVQTLIIEKDESFLKALVSAVQKAKEMF